LWKETNMPYYDNEDAGDLEASQAAGWSEALAENHLAGEHEGRHVRGCSYCEEHDEDDD
jgi:hypothetical protein